MWKTTKIKSNVHKTLNLDNCVEKTKFRKFFSYTCTEFSDIVINNFKSFSKIDENFCQKKWKCEQNSGFRSIIPKFLNRCNSLRNESKKIFLIPHYTLDRFSNDTTHNHLRWIYRSAKIVWTKKHVWVYRSSPTVMGRNNKSTSLELDFFKPLTWRFHTPLAITFCNHFLQFLRGSWLKAEALNLVFWYFCPVPKF